MEKQNRPSAGAGSGAGILNKEGREKLQAEFEKLNSSRANLDVLVARMGGLDGRQVVKEMKAMGFKWGHLTKGQVRGGWRSHGCMLWAFKRWQVVKEMKAMGFTWGHLTKGQGRGLEKLWVHV